MQVAVETAAATRGTLALSLERMINEEPLILPHTKKNPTPKAKRLKQKTCWGHEVKAREKKMKKYNNN